MDTSLRKTLNGCKLTDFEENKGHITIYFKDENGTDYAVNIKGEYENTILLEKEAAPEVEAQEQLQNLTLEQLINTESNFPLSYWFVAAKNEIDQLKLKIEKSSSPSSPSHF